MHSCSMQTIFLEGLAPLERVQVAYSLFGKPAYDEIHSVQLSFR